MPPLLKAPQLLKLLFEHKVDFAVIGGIAATLHGLDYITYDLDVCAPMTPDNIERILAALSSHNPRQRMRPDRAPFTPNLVESPPRNI